MTNDERSEPINLLCIISCRESARALASSSWPQSSLSLLLFTPMKLPSPILAHPSFILFPSPRISQVLTGDREAPPSRERLLKRFVTSYIHRCRCDEENCTRRRSEKRICEKRNDDLRVLDARKSDEVELRTESSAHRRTIHIISPARRNSERLLSESGRVASNLFL